MRYGLSLPPFEQFADPGLLARLARDAEEAGWDGFFLWDHMLSRNRDTPIADPWVALAAAAMTTHRIRLGTLITPVARRRPWKLARETVTVDRLSGGRVILGVGLGTPPEWEYAAFGEDPDDRVRAQKLDEGLAILDGLWRGEPFAFAGEHFHLEPPITFLPRPVQTPRIPIWVAGNWPNKPPIRRAARWDGACPEAKEGRLSPDDWRDILALIREIRADEAPFEAVHLDSLVHLPPRKAADHIAAYGEAGVTWWIEYITPDAFGVPRYERWPDQVVEKMVARLRQGPSALGRRQGDV